MKVIYHGARRVENFLRHYLHLPMNFTRFCFSSCYQTIQCTTRMVTFFSFSPPSLRYCFCCKEPPAEFPNSNNSLLCKLNFWVLSADGQCRAIKSPHNWLICCTHTHHWRELGDPQRAPPILPMVGEVRRNPSSPDKHQHPCPDRRHGKGNSSLLLQWMDTRP